MKSTMVFLNLLVLFCLHQCPPGMKQQVLSFYTKLLGRIHQPLLPHINVHRPVQVRSKTFYFVDMDRFNTWMCLLCRCHLYTVSVWSSVSLWLSPQKLIRLCGEILAAPTENEEIQFLCIVCAKLKQDPYLVNFFLEVSMMSIRCYHNRDGRVVFIGHQMLWNWLK